tara:strand:- start:186 stop:362 length:177 start_codon:yes stop_codon:yes gene_type:complete
MGWFGLYMCERETECIIFGGSYDDNCRGCIYNESSDLENGSLENIDFGFLEKRIEDAD